MIMHLSDDALLALAETGDRHPHLERCASCRARVDTAREALVALQAAPVPQPSPLFWDHFSARVRDAVAAEGAPRRRWALAWDAAWKPALAVGLTVCVLAASWSLGVFAPRDGRQATARSAHAVAGPAAEGDAARSVDAVAIEGDRAWDVVVEVAGRLDVESAVAAGYGLRPGSAGEAVLALSPTEQREFVRLMQASIADPSQ
jgi:hypothetical protein